MRHPSSLAVLVAVFLPTLIIDRLVAVGQAERCDGDGPPSMDETPTCKMLMDKLTECSQTTTKQDTIACYCTQNMLDMMVGCQGEQRECVRSYIFDSHHEEMMKVWHEACDEHITFAPTTSSLTSLAVTVDPAACQSAYDACLQRDEGLESCGSMYSAHMNATEAVDCICQSSQLWVASRCYTYGTKCNPDRTTRLSTMPEYVYCQPAEWSSLATPAAQSNANATKFHSPSPTTRPPAPSTITFGPAATASETRSAAVRGPDAWHWALIGQVIGLCVVMH